MRAALLNGDRDWPIDVVMDLLDIRGLEDLRPADRQQLTAVPDIREAARSRGTAHRTSREVVVTSFQMLWPAITRLRAAPREHDFELFELLSILDLGRARGGFNNLVGTGL